MTSTTSRPTETAVHPRRRSSRFTWLTVIAVVLAVALGFGAGFLTSQVVEDEPTGLADDATVSLIEDYMAAASAGDPESLAATTTPDFVVTVMSRSGVLAEVEGVEDMMTELGTPNGLEATSEFMLQDELVTSTYDELNSHGVQTFEITEGKISHVWVTMD